MNMHTLSHLNWLAIFAGTLGYFMLGALWYSFLFQKQWIALNKIDINNPDGKKGVGAIMFASFIMMLITSIAIGILSVKMGTAGLLNGIKLGLLTGVGFAFTSMAINMLYEKKPAGLYYINGGYQILGNIIAAVIIAIWK